MKKYQPDIGELNRQWRRMLYSRIENIFSYDGLPEEIPEREFKLGLFAFGKLIFFKIGDKLCVQNFSYTDRLDWYYVPKFGRVVNPWLPQGHQNFEFEVNKEAVIWNSTPDIYNFRQHSLVSDLIYKTACQLSENDLSYYCIQRNARLIAIFAADNDLEKAECNRVLDKMYNGDPDITMGQDMISKITAMSISENSMRGRLTELIEFQQYVLANFYHSFGINSNYNLKREQLNSNEIDVNKEVLRLNIEDMLKSRETGVEKINEIYNLNIRVHLNEEVYASLLEEQGKLEAGSSGYTDVSSITENSETNESSSANSMEIGRSENEDKPQSDENGTLGNNDMSADTEKSEERDIPSETTSESAETPTIQIQITAENVEEVNVTTDSNLSEKGDEEDERPDSDEEHNSERVEDEKSDD